VIVLSDGNKLSHSSVVRGAGGRLVRGGSGISGQYTIGPDGATGSLAKLRTSPRYSKGTTRSRSYVVPSTPSAAAGGENPNAINKLASPAKATAARLLAITLTYNERHAHQMAKSHEQRLGVLKLGPHPYLESRIS
jgi:hypothetical protein